MKTEGRLSLRTLPIWARVAATAVALMIVGLAAVTAFSIHQQKSLAITQATEFGDGAARTIAVGIAVVMASGDAAELKSFLAQARRSRGIKSVAVLRGAGVAQQYGAADSSAPRPDAAEQRTLDRNEPYSAVEETGGGLVYRAVFPMAASKSFLGKDCTACHDVKEGTVLGAVTLQVDLEQTMQASRTFRNAMLVVVTLFGGLVLAVVSFIVVRTVSRPLREVAAQIDDIANGDGDLTKRLHVRREDEVGELASGFNRFVTNLQDIMAKVKRTADTSAAASRELSAAADQLASGAQQQASSLEETAASLEQITGTVKQNADNARQANELAHGSRETAENGGEVVTAAVGAMAEITHSSKKIADIITTIDEIAFQTNLLALNAAVEAARAGEQGRGFAVVAAEVRNLAQRSALAAKEIKALIKDSVGKVQAGSDLVNRSGQTLTEIVTSVKRVTDIIAEIAAASQEQSTGVDQVNRAVTQMDQVVQNNAAQTDQLSTTAHAMASQAADLLGLVGRFKLGDDLDAEAAAPAAPVPAAPRPVSRTRPVPALHAAVGNGAHHTGNGHTRHEGFDEF